MRVLVSSMSAMAETAGPSSRARLLVEHFKDAGIEVNTCMAEDVNYKKVNGVKNHHLEIPMPLGLPKAIASRTFPIAQKLGIYILITFIVLGLSIFFTMSNSISNDSEE